MLRTFLVLLCFPLFAGAQERIGFHEVRLDSAGGILPWADAVPGRAYDITLRKVWDYWRLMPHSWESGPAFEGLFGRTPGLRRFYVMRTQDEFGVGGDQFAKSLSSWSIYYPFTGDRRLIDDMVEQAGIYLDHSLSPAGHPWPDLPYPCNLMKGAVYDGHLRFGPGVTQPDKAGSFGAELVTLYKITGNRKYLAAAVKIADTLAAHTQPSDADHSPLPFRGTRGRVSPPGPTLRTELRRCASSTRCSSFIRATRPPISARMD